jgi:FAD/FMN-containing dehydrogenase
VPKPPARTTIRATFASVAAAGQAVEEVVRERVVPATLELIDRDSLAAVARYLGTDALAPAGTEALLLIEVDGLAPAVAEEASRVEQACRRAGALDVQRSRSDAEREELWRVRRSLSDAHKLIAPLKINHDVVVPKGRIPRLLAVIDDLRREFGLSITCFGHAGDGNIHVNMMVDPAD